MFSFIGIGLMLVSAYLAGSVSSAIIISKLWNLPDPRREGSKNPGATNVLRLAGKKYAIIVLLGDMLKGLLPVIVARLFFHESVILAYVCCAAVMGHIFPVFFEFKGGKGVATALGAFLGYHFIMGVLAIVTWALVAKFTRYSSLASMIAIALMPFYALFVTGNLSAFFPMMVMTVFVFYKHRDNISRLAVGTEPKIKW